MCEISEYKEIVSVKDNMVDRIRSLYKIYRDASGVNEPSDKQKNYIRMLCNLKVSKGTMFSAEIDDFVVFQICKSYLSYERFNSNIGWYEIGLHWSSIVSGLRRETPLDRNSLELLQSVYNLEEVRSGETIENWNEVTVADYENLIRPVSRFCIIPNYLPIEIDFEYEYGKQLFLHKEGEEKNYEMYYLRFYNLMMLDIDHQNYDQLVTDLNSFITNGYCFDIYKTYKGFHVFVISHILPYNDIKSFLLMKALHCDNFYCLFSHKFGYNIRLNQKYNRPEPHVRQHLSTLGTPSNSTPHLLHLLKKLHTLQTLHSSIQT